MTATDELHRLLDERGVEYQYYEQNSWVKNTAWDMDVSDPLREVCAGFDEFEDGATLLRFWNATPEQAIAATLGRGTCRKVRVHMQIEDEMHCSECGRFIGFVGDISAPPYYYCPNCGRKVVDE